MTPPRPPRLARWLVGVTAPPHRREAILGDLAEEWAERSGRPGAVGWYWRQALRSAPASLAGRLRRSRRRHHEGSPSERGTEPMQTLLMDLRSALRALRRNPALTAVVLLTLGLGIGASTVVFSAVDGIVLRPFPFPEADRVVGVGTGYPRLGAEVGFWENLSPAEFEDVRDQAGTLEEVVAWDMGNRQIDTDGPPENVFTAFWWGDALRTVGMSAHVGRGFTEEELRTGAPAAILSHRLWRERFGADSTLVGGTLSINGTPHTLVGVLPEGLLVYGTDLWTVMPVAPSAYPRNRRQFQVLARIRDGASLAGVNAELEGIARRVEAAHGAELEEYQGWRIEARTWTDVNVATLKPAAAILTGAVGFVLLLVCANVANLLLVRSTHRGREMAVRTALGAGRTRLVRQLLTESVVLALAGGTVGIGVAALGNRGLQAFLDRLGVPVPGSIALDGSVLAFTAGVAVLAGIAFGLVPALHAVRGGLRGALQDEGKAATGGVSRQRLQRGLVGLEVALALALLAGGGLLVRSLVALGRVDPGVDAGRVLTMRLTLPASEYDAEGIRAFFQELTERAEAIPGVTRAAAASQFPPLAFSRRTFWREGMSPDPEARLPVAFTTVVTPGYFETLGVPVLRGRALGPEDGPDAPRVALVNETAARRYFPAGGALDARIKIGGPDSEEPWFRVVGVVADARNQGVDQEPQPEIFAPQHQVGGGNQLFLLVRADVDPASALPAVRRAVAEMDPDQPVYAIQTLEQAFAGRGGARRATTLLLGTFAVFALVLAAVGIYAVVAYTVGQRTREIGLRMALGAERGQVRRLVVRQALLPVVTGAAAGLAVALPLARTLRGLLFGVGSGDPATLGGVTVLLLGVALLASWLPARRASRLDPVRALRME